MKPLSACFLIFFVLLSSALSWHNMIYKADTLPEFYNDEVPNVQAAVSFFGNGAYKSCKYGFIYSSGIAVTWPSAVGWYLGRSMFASRLSCAFFSWVFSLLLVFCFLRHNGYSRIWSAAAAVCLWGLTVTPPLALPYWYGFMYNQGELNTILLIAFGIFLLAKRPFLSAFIFSVAFWQGKFIYLPLIGGILLAEAFSRKLSAKRTIGRLLIYALIFLLPLLIWMGWLLLKVNISALKVWLREQLGWFSYRGSMHAPVSNVEFSIAYLKERLTSPAHEWAGYTLGTKMKDLLFSFGAIAVTTAGLITVRKKIAVITEREKWINLAAALCIGLYCVFYFFINPFMWQRYFLPAVYTGFFLFVYWGAKWAKKAPFNTVRIFWAAAVFLIAAQLVNSFKLPFFRPGSSYARSCTDLYGSKCDPTCVNNKNSFNTTSF